MIRVAEWVAKSTPRARWWLLAATLVLLALAASCSGIRNGFTYDDVYIIQKNGIVHSLHGWWRLFKLSYWPRPLGADGYRPITMLAFATEWVIGGGSAWIFHAVNVALYCAMTVAVFWLASALLPLAAAWMAAALFAVHPVHVEAVAGVVGQSELSVGLLLTVATTLYIRRRLTGTRTNADTAGHDADDPSTGTRVLSLGAMLGIALCYAVGLFAKEHAIVLPALLLAAELTVVGDERPLRTRLVLIRPFMLGLTLVAVLYLAARYAVKGGQISGFQPFVVFQALSLSYSNRVLTMFGVVPAWVRLLLWPAHLSTEYAPPYVDIAQGPSLLQLPGLFLLVGVLGLGVVLARLGKAVRGPGSSASAASSASSASSALSASASFGIAWLCITLLPTSNFIIPAGIILAERTLFLPSVGAMLALGAAWPWLLARVRSLRWNGAERATRILLPATLGAILVAGSWRSVTRTAVWHDNERLFWQAIADAPDSYRAHYMLGAWMFETGRKKEGEQHYRRAIALFPYDPFMSYNLAQQYQWAGMFKAAIPFYRWSFEIWPRFREGEGRLQLALCLLDAEDFAEAREQAFTGMRFGGVQLKQLRRVVQIADSGLAVQARNRRSRGPVIGVAVQSATPRKLPRTVQITAGGAAAALSPRVISR